MGRHARRKDDRRLRGVLWLIIGIGLLAITLWSLSARGATTSTPPVVPGHPGTLAPPASPR